MDRADRGINGGKMEEGEVSYFTGGLQLMEKEREPA